MVRAKLLYAALLAGLLVFYVLYIDSLPLMLLIAALLLPPVLKAGLLVLHFRAEAGISCQSATCCANESIPVTVTLRNDSVLYFPRGEAKIRISHGFGKGSETIRLKFPVQNRNTTRLTFFVGADACGTVTAELLHVRVYDIFRLFHTNIRRKSRKLELLVLPRPVLLPLDASAPPVENPESIRFENKPGDDPSELFGIRPYRAGDPISRIHWKLSSHSDTLFLKEFGSPVDKHALLLIEYRSPSGRKRKPHDADALLTLVFSLASQLIDAEHPLTIAWYDTHRREVVRTAPVSHADLTEVFRSLYDALPYLGVDAPAIQDMLGAAEYSSAALVTNVPDTSMLGIIEHTITANHRSVLVVSEQESTLSSESVIIRTIRMGTGSLPRIIV